MVVYSVYNRTIAIEKKFSSELQDEKKKVFFSIDEKKKLGSPK